MGYGSTFCTRHNSLLCEPLGAGFNQLCAPNSRIKKLTVLIQIRRQTIDALDDILALDRDHLCQQRFGAS